jgi:hypothetical protein
MKAKCSLVHAGHTSIYVRLWPAVWPTCRRLMVPLEVETEASLAATSSQVLYHENYVKN